MFFNSTRLYKKSHLCNQTTYRIIGLVAYKFCEQVSTSKQRSRLHNQTPYRIIGLVAHKFFKQVNTLKKSHLHNQTTYRNIGLLDYKIFKQVKTLKQKIMSLQSNNLQNYPVISLQVFQSSRHFKTKITPWNNLSIPPKVGVRCTLYHLHPPTCVITHLL